MAGSATQALSARLYFLSSSLVSLLGSPSIPHDGTFSVLFQSLMVLQSLSSFHHCVGCLALCSGLGNVRCFHAWQYLCCYVSDLLFTTLSCSSLLPMHACVAIGCLRCCCFSISAPPALCFCYSQIFGLCRSTAVCDGFCRRLVMRV
jgi:hypothetical protein